MILHSRELHEHATSLAAALQRQGLRPQESLAAYLLNTAEFAVALIAATILNIAFVPLDPRSLSRPDEIRHQLKVIKPDAMLVAGEQFAKDIDKLADTEVHKPRLKILIYGQSPTVSGWLRLKDVLLESSEQHGCLSDDVQLAAVNVEEDTALMVFTSGTSGLPKACRLTCRNITSLLKIPDAVSRAKPKDRYLQHFPVAHMGALGAILRVWGAGACIVIPSPAFDAAASLHAIERERCTIMGAVPSIVDQLIGLASFSPAKVESLDIMFVGATIVSPEIIAKCKEAAGLGVPNVTSGYGLTEALSIFMKNEDGKIIIENGIASVGRPAHGVKLKICTPDSREPCMIGEVGELHLSTPALTPGYLGIEDKAFYEDRRVRWFATGDQARMNTSGAVFILGRYKDVIIRGGENLSPALIEQCINAKYLSMQAQIVGFTDAIIGEVPVAVMRTAVGTRPDASHIRRYVRERLGPAAVPEKLLTLQDLNLESFPSTTSGKVQKFELKRMVARYYQDKAQIDDQEKYYHMPGSSLDSIKAILLNTLGTLLGHEVRSAALYDQPPAKLLDSLSLMKLASILKANHDLEVSMAEMIASQNIHDLAAYAKRGRILDSSPELAVSLSKAGPPEQADLLYEEEAGLTRSRTESILRKLGLSWENDVQEVYPIAGTLAFRFMKEAAFRHRWSMDTGLSSYDQARQVIETSLRQWPVLRSVAVEYNDDLRLLVALKAHNPYFDLAVTKLPDVETREDLERTDVPYTHHSGSFPESLPFLVKIARVRQSGTYCLLLATNHAVYDNISIQSWAEDLRRIINGYAKVDRPSFKSFADAYFIYQDSALARRARDYHKGLLEQIGLRPRALWPPGDDLIAKRPVASVPSNSDRNTNEYATPPQRAGVCWQKSCCPDMSKSRDSQNPSPSLIVKMAVSIFNCGLTGERYALFGMIVAARTWPFMSHSIAEHMPNAYDIAGPTLEGVTDVVKIEPDEEVGQLYARMDSQQKRLNQNQHLPYSMLRQLGADSGGLNRQAMRQIFNWIHGRRREDTNSSSALQPVGVPGQDNDPPAGVAWMFMLDDAETLSARLRWDLTLFSEQKASEYLRKVLSIVEMIANPHNWRTKVGALFELGGDGPHGQPTLAPAGCGLDG